MTGGGAAEAPRSDAVGGSIGEVPQSQGVHTTVQHYALHSAMCRHCIADIFLAGLRAA